MKRFGLAVIITLAFSGAAISAEYNEGDACTSAGAYHVKNDASGVYHLICNGSTWQQQQTWLADGKVGIGTDSPTVPLDLEAPGYLLLRIKSAGPNSDAVVHIEGKDGGGRPAILFTYPGMGSGAIGVSKQGTVGGLGLYRSNNINTAPTFFLTSSGNIGIGKTDPAVLLDVAGDIHYTGLLADMSDRRMKTDIAPLAPQLAKIAALQPVSFRMKDDPKARTELGFTAQDVEPVYPELVGTTPDGTKSLNYIGMIAPLVASVQELKAENEALRRQNHELSRRMDVLEGKVRPPLKPYNH